MPIDHDASPFVAGMPLGHEVLVPSAKLLGIRGASGGGVTPDMGRSNMKDGIGHIGNRLPERRFAQEFTTNVMQVAGAGSVVAVSNAFNPQIGSQGVQAQQQSFS